MLGAVGSRLISLVTLSLVLLNLAACCGAAGNAGGCTRDTDCKGDRVCTAGQCREPQPPSAPAPQPRPTSVPAPRATSQPAKQPKEDIPPGGCLVDGVIYDSKGQVYGCSGGGNWCASVGPLRGGCKR